MIIKWSVHNWGGTPTKKEYARETEHFYMHADGRRDSKSLRYDRYFDTEAEALECIAEMTAKRTREREIDRIKLHAVELLASLESVTADLFYQIEAKHGAKAASEYPSIVEARAIVAKAKGTAQ